MRLPCVFFNSRKISPCRLIYIIVVLWIALSTTSIVAVAISIQSKVHDMRSFPSGWRVCCHQQRNVLTYMNIQSHTRISSTLNFLSQRSALFSSANSINNSRKEDEHDSKTSPKNIAIVGGGLAGLSTAYHLLRYSIDHNIVLPSLTIIDKAEPGKGGASSVAGG